MKAGKFDTLFVFTINLGKTKTKTGEKLNWGIGFVLWSLRIDCRSFTR